MTNDILPSGVRKLIVLESRHKDEVYEGYPAAGAGGRNLTDTLLGKRCVPFSLLLQVPEVAKFYGFPDLSHIGIMNVSPVPLQGIAYTENGLQPPKNIAKLEELKKKIEARHRPPDRTFDDHALEDVRKDIYFNFSKRLRTVESTLDLVVPCGGFARHFLQWYMNDNPNSVFAVHSKLPHPTSQGGDWKKLTEARIQRLRQELEIG